MRTLFSAILFFTLNCLTFAALAADSFTFNGTVNQGQSFSHVLPHGLEFTLEPGGSNVEDPLNRSDGWELGVQNQVNTTSFPHGPNPTDILGWHFCSDAAQGLPFDLLERHFRFTVSETEAKASIDQYWCKRQVDDKCSGSSDVAVENTCRTREDDKCDAVFRPQELLYLSFRIINYTLDKPSSSKFCFIKSINFTVSGEYAPSKKE